MLDLMAEGYYSTNALSKKLRVSRSTIDTYRPLVDQLIAKTKVDRNAIRALQIRRTYELIELMMEDLKQAETIKERSLIYGNIHKMSSHLALITGLNVETQVHVDPTKLVIIRSNTRNKPQILDASVTDVEATVTGDSSEV